MQRNEEVSGAIKHMKKNGALWIVIFAFAAGIIMLIIGANFKSDDKGNDISDSYAYDEKSFEAYKNELEQNIYGICKKVSGGMEAHILLDFKTSGEIIYAKNSNVSSDGDRRDEYVIVGSGTGAQALYLGQNFPELSGIGVVFSSSASQRIKDEISSLLAAAYGLPLTRIYVI